MGPVNLNDLISYCCGNPERFESEWGCFDLSLPEPIIDVYGRPLFHPFLMLVRYHVVVGICTKDPACCIVNAAVLCRIFPLLSHTPGTTFVYVAHLTFEMAAYLSMTRGIEQTSVDGLQSGLKKP